MTPSSLAGGYPSDNLGAILAIADHLARKGEHVTVKDVLECMIKFDQSARDPGQPRAAQLVQPRRTRPRCLGQGRLDCRRVQAPSPFHPIQIQKTLTKRPPIITPFLSNVTGGFTSLGTRPRDAFPSAGTSRRALFNLLPPHHLRCHHRHCHRLPLPNLPPLCLKPLPTPFGSPKASSANASKRAPPRLVASFVAIQKAWSIVF
jgi:hypothetical protein